MVLNDFDYRKLKSRESKRFNYTKEQTTDIRYGLITPSISLLNTALFQIIDLYFHKNS